MSTAALPRLQRDDARDLANEIRTAMAVERRALRSVTFREGCAQVADMLERPEELVARMKLGYLLRSVNRMGQIKAAKVATYANAGLNRRIGPIELPGEIPSLTLRQRAIIAGHLRRIAKGEPA